MTSAYSTTSLPTATASNLPLSVPSSNRDHENAITTQDNDTNKFLYKDTASIQSLSKENDPSIGNKEVVMRNRGGGPAHKRKELHHARRHTLQGGVDFSMVGSNTNVLIIKLYTYQNIIIKMTRNSFFVFCNILDQTSEAMGGGKKCT